MQANHGDPDQSVLAERISAASPDGVVLVSPAMARKISLAMLALGGALLWPVPLGGVFFIVTAGFGLAISSEADLASPDRP